MVLEEGATASQSFEDNVPFSDSDPYASGSWGSESPFSRYPFSAFPVQINLPPRNFFGRLLLSEKKYSERVAMPLAIRLNSTSAVMKRFPNQEETDAITSQVARKVYVSSFGRTLGLMIGISGVRLPKEVHPPKDIAAGMYSKVLIENIRMNATTVAWSMGRSIFMVGLWTVGAGFFADFYGSVVQAYATMSDPRLAEYRQKVQSQDPVELRKQITESNKETVDRWRKETFQRHAQSRGMVSSGQDDASPTGGMGDYTFSGSYSEGNHTATHDSDSRAQGSTASNVGVPGGSQARQQHQYPDAPSSTSNDTGSGTDFFDDASPTAQDHSSAAGNASSGGSAWARIRYGASQSTSKQHQQQQQQQQQYESQYESQYDSTPSSSTGGSGSAYGSRTNSDFQYSNYERDRQTAKEQAQKEFDRMVDSERQGSDVSADASNGQQSLGRGGAWARR